jgi:hypothetical protein
MTFRVVISLIRGESGDIQEMSTIHRTSNPKDETEVVALLHEIHQELQRIHADSQSLVFMQRSLADLALSVSNLQSSVESIERQMPQ